MSQDKEAKRKALEHEISRIQPVERGFTGRLFTFIGKVLIRTCTRFEIRGVENLPESAPYILAPNHETYVDGLIASMGLNTSQYEKLTCLAAKELETDHGLFGKIMMRVGRGIPLDRKGNPLTSLKVCIKQLENGNILLIHPEGTRSADGKLGHIQDGCGFIAKHAKTLVVPTFIDGGYEIFSRHMKKPSFWQKGMKRSRLIVHYGAPLNPADYKNSKELTQALSQVLHAFYANKEVPRTYEGENLKYIENLQAKLDRLKNIDE